MIRIDPVPCPLRKHPTVPDWYHAPRVFAFPMAFTSPFMTHMQSYVLLNALPNFATNCSLVHMVSFSLLELHENASVPVITLADWDTKSRYAASMAAA